MQTATQKKERRYDPTAHNGTTAHVAQPQDHLGVMTSPSAVTRKSFSSQTNAQMWARTKQEGKQPTAPWGLCLLGTIRGRVLRQAQTARLSTGERTRVTGKTGSLGWDLSHHDGLSLRPGWVLRSSRPRRHWTPAVPPHTVTKPELLFMKTCLPWLSFQLTLSADLIQMPPSQERSRSTSSLHLRTHVCSLSTKVMF